MGTRANALSDAWFRVTAKTATAIAVPSSSVSVYAPEAPARVELKLAA